MIEKWVAVLFVVFFGVGVAVGALWSVSETSDHVIALLDDIKSKLEDLRELNRKLQTDNTKMEGELKLMSAMLKALCKSEKKF